MATPSEQVAAQIVKRLIEAKLLRVGDETKVFNKLTDGTMNVQDWRLAVELAGDKDKKNE
jgi:hypothetical protein